MAKAFFNQPPGSAVFLRAESVGTQPAKHVDAVVVEAMREASLNLSQEQPRLLTNEMVERATRVITMGLRG